MNLQVGQLPFQGIMSHFTQTLISDTGLDPSSKIVTTLNAFIDPEGEVSPQDMNGVKSALRVLTSTASPKYTRFQQEASQLYQHLSHIDHGRSRSDTVPNDFRDPIDEFEAGLNLDQVIIWRRDYKQSFIEAVNRFSEQVNSVEYLQEIMDQYISVRSALNNDICDFYKKGLLDTNDKVTSQGFANLYALYLKPQVKYDKDFLNFLDKNQHFLNELPQAYQYKLNAFRVKIILDEAPISKNLKKIKEIEGDYTGFASRFRCMYKGEKYRLSEISAKVIKSDSEQEKTELLEIYRKALEEFNDQISLYYSTLIELRNKVAKKILTEERRYRIQTILGKEIGNTFSDFNSLYKYAYRFSFSEYQLVSSQARRSFAPVVKKVMQLYANVLGCDSLELMSYEDFLKAKNIAKDKVGKPLKPLRGMEERDVLDLGKALLERIYPSFSKIVDELAAIHHTDLLDRDNKAFRFLNLLYERVDEQTEVLPYLHLSLVPNEHGIAFISGSLVHELGHAMQLTHLMKEITSPSLHWALTLGVDMAEIFSHIFEEISQFHFDFFDFNPEQKNQALLEVLATTLTKFMSEIVIADYEAWIYENPDVTSEQRDQKFITMMKESGLHLDHWDDIFALHVRNKTSHLFNMNAIYFPTYVLARLVGWLYAEKYREVYDPQNLGSAQDLIEQTLIPAFSQAGGTDLKGAWEMLGVNFSAEEVPALAQRIEQEFDALVERAFPK